MPKVESPVAACVTLIVLASLAFALSLREGSAAPATDQRQPALTIAATAAATQSPTATAAAIAFLGAAPATTPAATAPAPSPTPTPAASPSPEPSQPPAATPPPAPTTAVVATEGLNLREGPGPDYPVITVLGRGDVLALTGAQHLIGEYRWVEVIAPDGQQGWVFGEPIGMP